MCTMMNDHPRVTKFYAEECVFRDPEYSSVTRDRQSWDCRACQRTLSRPLKFIEITRFINRQMTTILSPVS